jgi:hypothetical protein
VVGRLEGPYVGMGGNVGLYNTATAFSYVFSVGGLSEGVCSYVFGTYVHTAVTYGVAAPAPYVYVGTTAVTVVVGALISVLASRCYCQACHYHTVNVLAC